MKKLKGYVEILSLVFSLALVGFFVYKTIVAEMYLVSAIIIIIFMMLLKIGNIDYFKITNNSLEVKDEKDEKHS